MSRRVAKPLVPLLVAVVAVILGLFATSTSHADQSPGVTPPAETVRVSAPAEVGPPDADHVTTDSGACSSCLNGGED